jgi:hypothetical protein
MRQVDRLIATFDTGNDLEREMVVSVRPPERLPRPRGVRRVVDHERNPVAAKQIPPTERRMLVRLPVTSSHRDHPRMRKARIHLTPVTREVRGYQRTRVAALRKRLLLRRECIRCHGYGRGDGQRDSYRWQPSSHLDLLDRRCHGRKRAGATLQEPGNGLDEVLF